MVGKVRTKWLQSIILVNFPPTRRNEHCFFGGVQLNRDINILLSTLGINSVGCHKGLK